MLAVYKVATKIVELFWDKIHFGTDFQNTELPVSLGVGKSPGAISPGRL